MATAIGAACAPALAYCWKYYPGGMPPEWASGTLPSAAGVVVVLILWQGARAGFRRRRFATRRAEAAKGDRIAIYIADLHGDNATQTARASVIDSILREIGRDAVEVVPAGIELRLSEGSLDHATDAANVEARELLRKKKGDLLIWGRVHTIGQENVLELRFVGADADGGDAQRFGFTKELLLEEKFAPEMGTVLAALAASLSLPATRQRGTVIWKRLLPFAARLERLAHKPDLKLRPDDRGRLLENYALMLDVIGEQSGNSAKLEEAAAIFRAALEVRTRKRVPLEWAMTQNNLGKTLTTLGTRMGEPTRLEEAVEAYREALKEHTRARVPLRWAMTQNNLAVALLRLGERDHGTALLEEALAICRAALEVRTRDLVPFDWAMTQANLGAALAELGERESGTARLEQAVTAYRAALQEWTRQRVPLQWATTQTNLANALSCLGGRENEPARLEEAVAIYRAALAELPRDRVPLDWAMAQFNLGNTLLLLRRWEKGTIRLKEAIMAYRAASQEYTRERVSLQWAATQNALGNALSSLGVLESKATYLKEAVVAYSAALREYTREQTPLKWAMSTGNHGVALMQLAERRSDADMAKTALEDIEIAATTMRDGGHAPFATYYESQLPVARALLNVLSTDLPPRGGGFVKEPEHPRRARWRRSTAGVGLRRSSRYRR